MQYKTKVILITILFLATLVGLMYWSLNWNVDGWIVMIVDAVLLFNIFGVMVFGLMVVKEVDGENHGK